MLVGFDVGHLSKWVSTIVCLHKAAEFIRLPSTQGFIPGTLGVVALISLIINNNNNDNSNDGINNVTC